MRARTRFFRAVAFCRIRSAGWRASGWRVCWAASCSAPQRRRRARRLEAWQRIGAVCAEGEARAADLLSRRRVAHRSCGTTSRRSTKHHGEPLPGEENLVTFQGKNGNLMKSPWPFAPAGQSGKMISTLLPNMARHVDDIAFIHSMQSKTNTHGPGCVFMNTGTIFEGFPERRRVGRLRAGQRERESAGLRGDSRYPRRTAERQSELEQRLSCRPSIRPS